MKPLNNFAEQIAYIQHTGDPLFLAAEKPQPQVFALLAQF
jgi:hypothetical protein